VQRDNAPAAAKSSIPSYEFSMNPEDLDDAQLLYLVGTTDKELFDAGMDIKRRGWQVRIP
jgi:hypothetical protein